MKWSYETNFSNNWNIINFASRGCEPSMCFTLDFVFSSGTNSHVLRRNSLRQKLFMRSRFLEIFVHAACSLACLLIKETFFYLLPQRMNSWKYAELPIFSIIVFFPILQNFLFAFQKGFAQILITTLHLFKTNSSTGNVEVLWEGPFGKFQCEVFGWRVKHSNEL